MSVLLVQTGSGSKDLTPLFWFFYVSTLLFVDIYTRMVCFKMCNTVGKYGVGLIPFPNYEFAFSLRLSPLSMYGVYAFVLSFLIVYVVRTWQGCSNLLRVAWIMVFVGALTNVFERLAIGYVRDFIRIGSGYFNLGDIYILCGIALVLYENFRHTERSAIFRNIP